MVTKSNVVAATNNKTTSSNLGGQKRKARDAFNLALDEGQDFRTALTAWRDAGGELGSGGERFLSQSPRAAEETGIESIDRLGLGAETQDYVSQAYQHYARPYTQEFEELGKATKKEALQKGLYLSGDYGRAIGENIEDYSRKVAENVVLPLAREGMQMGYQAAELGLQREQLGEETRQFDIQLGEETRQFDVGTRQQQQQFMTTVTGRVRGPMIAQNFGVTDEMIEGLFDNNGDITDTDRWLTAASAITEAANEQGVYLTNEMGERLLRGEEVDVTGAPTLDRDRLTTQREQFTDQLAQNLTLSDADRDEKTRQFNVSTMRRQVEYVTDVTGKYGVGTVSGELLGLDVSQLWDEDGNITSVDLYLQMADDFVGVMEAAGIELSDNDIDSILRGKTITVSGALTLQGRQAASAEAAGLHARRMEIANLALEQESQDLDEALARARESGTYVDPVTGETVETLEKQRLDLDETARMMELTGDADGKDEDGNWISSLAATYQAEQIKWQDASEKLDAAIKRAEQSGDFVDPDTQQTVETLKKQLQDTNKRHQEASLNLEQEKEYARQRETFAQLTGQYKPGEVSLEMMGFQEDLLYDADGNVDMDYFFEIADDFNDTAKKMLGREPTPTEIAAMLRGEKISMGDPIDTLAKMAQDAGITGVYGEDKTKTLDAVIQYAQLTGYLGDGEDQTNTLAGNRAELDEQISLRVQSLNEQAESFRQNMDLAREKGYWELGENGIVTASEMGIDTRYTSTMTDKDDILATYEARRLKEVYREMAGEDLSDPDVVSMLKGNGKSVTSPIRIQTVAARAEANRALIEVGNLMGTLGEMKTAAAHQFEENLKEQGKLTTAEVARISADMARADKELEGQLVQWASQTNIDIAQITGQFGIDNEITAADLGVVTKTAEEYDSIDEFMRDVDRNTPALRTAFNTTFGRDPSGDELSRLMQGETLAVDTTPTLAARQLAQLISAQSMESANDMFKFTQEYDLDIKEFNEMEEHADLEHGRLMKEMANQHELDRMDFALARSDLEAKHTGQWQMTGKITAADLGFTIEVAALEAMPQDDLLKYAESMISTYEAVQGEEFPGKSQSGKLGKAFEMLRGESSITVEAQWTQDARETAREYGMNERSFVEATNQFNRTFLESNRQNYLQMTGMGTDPDGVEVMTQGYRAWLEAQKDIKKVESRRDNLYKAMKEQLVKDSVKGTADPWKLYVQAWRSPTTGEKAFTRDHATGDEIWGSNELRAEMVAEFQNLTIPEQIGALSDMFEQAYGWPPHRQDIAEMFIGGQRPYGHNGAILNKAIAIRGDANVEDIEKMMKILSNQVYDTEKKMSGWETAGRIGGQLLSVGATVGAMYLKSKSGGAGG